MEYSTVNPFDSCHAYEFSNLTSISQPLIKLERCIEINIVSVAAHGTHTWRLRLFLCQTTFVLSRALSSIHRPCLPILIQIASFIIIQGVWFDRNNNVKCIKGQRCMLLKIILWPNFVQRYLHSFDQIFYDLCKFIETGFWSHICKTNLQLYHYKYQW